MYIVIYIYYIYIYIYTYIYIYIYKKRAGVRNAVYPEFRVLQYSNILKLILGRQTEKKP